MNLLNRLRLFRFGQNFDRKVYSPTPLGYPGIKPGLDLYGYVRQPTGLRKKALRKIRSEGVKNEKLFERQRREFFSFSRNAVFFSFFPAALNFLLLFVSRQKVRPQI